MICYVVIGVILVIIAVSLSIFLIVKHRKKKAEKMKGSGLIIEPDKTIFKFGEEIYPMISHEIFDNEFIKECWNVYNEFVNKEEKHREERFSEILDIMNCSHVVYNKFIAYIENLSESIKKLKEFYLSIELGDYLKDFYEEHNRLVKVITKDTDINYKIRTYSKDVLECINKYSDLFVYPDELKRLLQNSPKNNWNRIIRLFQETYLTKEIMRDSGKSTIGTDAIRNSNDYFSMFNYTREKYIKAINDLFGDSVKFVTKGEIIQSINKENVMVKAEKGVTTMFSSAENENMRDWMKGTDYKDEIEDLKYYMENGTNRADVVPAAVSAVVTQILVILYVHKHSIHKLSKDKFDKFNFSDLFEFLKVTRLNMIFINILSNTVEDKDFNVKLSNSYIINEK